MRLIITIHLIVLISNIAIAQMTNIEKSDCCSYKELDHLREKQKENKFFLRNEVDYLPKNFCGINGWQYSPKTKFCHNTIEDYLSYCLYNVEAFNTLGHTIIEISSYLKGDMGIRASNIPDDPCIEIKIKINKEGTIDEANIITSNLNELTKTFKDEKVAKPQLTILDNMKKVINQIKTSTCNPALFERKTVNLELSYMIIFREDKKLKQYKILH